MISIEALKKDTFKLKRLLRKDSIERAVVVLQIGLVAVSILLCVLLARDAIVHHGIATKVVSDLTSSVDTIVAEKSEQPKEPKQKKVNYKIIAEKSIFGPLTVGAQPQNIKAQPPPKNPLSLIGTFLAKGEPPTAIIEDPKKSIQDIFNVGQNVFESGTVKAIYDDKVEIDRGNGEIETLMIDDTPSKGGSTKEGVASTGGDEYAVEESELNKALENLPLLLTQARAVPYFKEGKSIGLRLFAIRAGSLYEKIGLKNGDVLKAINGSDLGDMTQALKIFERLKEEKNINVNLEREGQERTFRYSIR